VKAAQGVPTEDIHPKGFAYLVPELFSTIVKFDEWFEVLPKRRM
jgi:hypothetical protein